MEYQELTNELVAKIESVGLDPNEIEALVIATIEEDLAGGEDVTSVATIDESAQAVGDFRARRAGVIAGVLVAEAVLNVLGITELERYLSDGERAEEGQIIFTARGNTRALLLAERTALNFLGRLSGIASMTHRWVVELEGTGAKVRDTRKTTPLFRELEKYAVRMGGGLNHRMSLSDAALIKDNHIAAAGSVVAAFEAVRRKYPDMPVEVEVDTLVQLKEVIEAGVDLVLLDNMSLEETKAAVAINEGRTKLESSGGLTLENAKSYARTGVDYLAVGALTHSAPGFDIGLDLR